MALIRGIGFRGSYFNRKVTPLMTSLEDEFKKDTTEYKRKIAKYDRNIHAITFMRLNKFKFAQDYIVSCAEKRETMMMDLFLQAVHITTLKQAYAIDMKH